jgi:LruC domain-containing protein
MHRPAWILGLGLLGLGLAAPASAQDADGDGVADAADAFPCDAARASVSYFPGASSSALLAFEDQWPGVTDLDFNDVAVRVHYRLERDAAGAVVSLAAVVDPVALGGELSSGLGLALPVARGGVSVRRRVGGGAWEALALEADAAATVVLSTNLRELYADATGRINARAGEARQSGARLEVEVSFATPAALAVAAAPFDVFIFRSGDLSHQIHFPQYAGTAAMDTSLFNSQQDASTATRRFVHLSGVPAALNLMTTTRYPLEETRIFALFPDITAFAISGGAERADFYASGVVAANGHDVPALALPAVAAASTACVFRANSRTDFSGVQGQKGWYYGYYPGSDLSPAGFRQLPMFHTNATWRHVTSTPPWTLVYGTGMHPNGTNQSIRGLEYAVRRWVSSARGTVRVTGRLAKENLSCGNGITGRIYRGSSGQLWSQSLSSNNGTGVTFDLTVQVNVGDAIDFAVDPVGNDNCDGTIFDAEISSL